MRFIMLASIFLLFLAESAEGTGLSTKKYKLSVFSLNLFTGLEPRDGKLCAAAQYLVVDAVNQRKDILSDYEVELDMQDEGLNGFFTVKRALEYQRRFDNTTEVMEGSRIYQSPLNMGPGGTPGCKSWGSVAAHVNMVAITTACAVASQTARRDLYPNMYRTRPPGDMNMYTRMAFLMQKTSIRKIGILFYSINPYNFENAIIFYRLCITNGFEVQAFEASMDYNDGLMLSLKEKDIRIFSIEGTEPAGYLTFLCQSYKFRFTGPRYLFLFQLVSFIDIYATPDKMIPTNCTRQMIEQQWKWSLFIGLSFEALEPPPVRTILNHTIDDFEELFDSPKYGNKLRTADRDFRHLCYDKTLQTLLILNATEEKLVRNYNLTLRDYRRYPELVMRIANQSAIETDFTSLRYGRFRYSSRGEYDTGAQMMAVYSLKEKKLIANGKIFCPPNGSLANVSTFVIEKIRDFDLHIPNDSSYRFARTREVPTGAFAASVILASLSTVLQLVTMKDHLWNKAASSERSQYAIEKSILLLGCIVLNSAALVVISTSLSLRATVANCYLEIILLATGVCLIHSCLSSCLCNSFGRMNLPVVTRTAKKRSSKTRSTILKDVTPSISVATTEVSGSHTLSQRHLVNVKNGGNGASYGPLILGCMITLNVALFIGWFSSEQLRFDIKQLAKETTYDEAQDALITRSLSVCSSPNYDSWLLALIGLNAIPLFVAIASSLKLRGWIAANAENPVGKTVKRLITATIAGVTLYFGTVAVVSLLSGYVAQLTTISFACIAYSAMISGIIFWRKNVARKL